MCLIFIHEETVPWTFHNSLKSVTGNMTKKLAQMKLDETWHWIYSNT